MFNVSQMGRAKKPKFGGGPKDAFAQKLWVSLEDARSLFYSAQATTVRRRRTSRPPTASQMNGEDDHEEAGER